MTYMPDKKGNDPKFTEGQPVKTLKAAIDFLKDDRMSLPTSPSNSASPERIRLSMP